MAALISGQFTSPPQDESSDESESEDTTSRYTTDEDSPDTRMLYVKVTNAPRRPIVNLNRLSKVLPRGELLAF